MNSTTHRLHYNEINNLIAYRFKAQGMYFLSRNILLTLFTSFLLCIQHLAFAQEDFSDRFQWRTLESEHFYVHFKHEDLALAEKNLQYAEQALEQVGTKFDWIPSYRVHLVLSNQQDNPNGYATPIPFNYIVIYSPQPTDFNELQDYDDWLRQLLIHELTHTVHLDKVAGAPKVFRYIFGRNPLFFPNLFQPNFFKEGLATYIETSWERGAGRGQSAYYDMMMRLEVEKGLLSLSEAQLVPDQWPLNVAYLYGVYFYQFIDDVYGPDKIEEYVQIYSRQLIPFLLYKPARAISEQDGLTNLWNEYLSWLEKRFEPQIDSIKAAGITESKAITTNGYFNGKPFVDNTGRLFYAKFDEYKPTYLVENINGKEKKLTRVRSNIVIVGRHDDSLYYLQSSSCKHNKQTYDLYRYKLNSWFNPNQKITHCESIVQARFAENSPVMAAVVEDNGRQKLILFNADNKAKTILYHSAYEESFNTPNLTQDLNSIVVSRKDENRNWHITKFNIKDRKFTPLLIDEKMSYYMPQLLPSSALSDEALSNDDTFLYVSDAQKLLQIWQHQGQSSKLITRELGGAINPSYNSKDQTIVFQSYSEQGWNIHQQDLAYIEDTPIIQLNRPGKGFNSQWTEEKASFTQKNYNPLLSIAPRSWWLAAYNTGKTSELGITTSGRDILNFHNYTIGASWDFENDVAQGYISYTIYNHFSLGAGRSHDFTEGTGQYKEDKVIKETNDQFAAFFHSYWNFDFSSFTWQAGGVATNKTQEGIADFNKDQFIEDDIATGGIALNYFGTSRSIESISESFGRNIKLTAEYDDREVHFINQPVSLRHGALGTLDWREFINIYQAHVFALRGFIGLGQEGIEPFQLGGDSSDLFALQTPIYQREQSLRGYKNNIPELTGRKAKLFSGEYRFPIYTEHKGWSSWPIGLHKIHGNVFYDTGAATNDDDYTFYSSTGAELTLQLDLGYAAIMEIAAGGAVPLDETSDNPDKDPSFYFRLSSGF